MLRPIFARSLLVALAIVPHIIAFLVLLLVYSGTGLQDIRLYHKYGLNMQGGQLPYRDFAMEYPPLAAILFWAPTWIAQSLSHYRITFAGQMLAIDLLGVIIALWAIRRHAPRATIVGVVIMQPLWLLLAGRSIVLQRFDLAPAVLTLLALVLLVEQRTRLAWIVLGLATALKIYPVILVPLFLLSDRRGRSLRQSGADLAGFGLACLIPAVIATQGSLSALRSFFRYHAERGIELETFYASLLMLRGDPGLQLSTVVAYGAIEIVSPITPVLAMLALPVTAFALAAIYLLVRTCRTALLAPTSQFESLARLSTAMLLIFMLCGKVLSAQYIIWLYPMIALLGQPRAIIWVLFTLVCGLTQWIYPTHLAELSTFSTRAVTILALRNGALLALLTLVLWPLLANLGAAEARISLIAHARHVQASIWRRS